MARLAALLLDATWQDRFQSCWSIPLAADGRTAGVMQFGFSKSYEWLPREQELLAAAAERCLMAAEKARLMEDLAPARRAGPPPGRAHAARRGNGAPPHQPRAARRSRPEPAVHPPANRIDRAGAARSDGEWIGEAAGGARSDRAHHSRNAPPDRRAESGGAGTTRAWARLCASWSTASSACNPCRVKLQLSSMGGLPQQTEIIAYRLVQECFNNIGKHSAASGCKHFRQFRRWMAKLAVEDNGVGFQRRGGAGRNGIVWTVRHAGAGSPARRQV